MKKVIICFVYLLYNYANLIFAQYNKINVHKHNASFRIIQIDFREFSTLIHIQYENIDSSQSICANEDLVIQNKKTLEKYKLLNSINLPIGPKKHMFEGEKQILRFTLEFEKVPNNIEEFDLLESRDKRFNFLGISIDTTVKKDFLNISSFIKETPVKEYSYYYKEGSPVLYYKHKGLMIAVVLTYNENYGQYYQANILVQNCTGKEFNIYPDNMTAKYYYKVKPRQKKKKIVKDDLYSEPDEEGIYGERISVNDTVEFQNVKVLSYEDYMRIVQNKQAWNVVAVSLSESFAASDAGYSASIGKSISHGYFETNGQVNGNNSLNIDYISSTYSTVNEVNASVNYNGSAAYAAQQNAKKNVEAFKNQQFQIKRSLSDGYLKLNTIMNQTEYICYVNIPYAKNDGISLSISMNGSTYVFLWQNK